MAARLQEPGKQEEGSDALCDRADELMSTIRSIPSPPRRHCPVLPVLRIRRTSAAWLGARDDELITDRPDLGGSPPVVVMHSLERR